MTEQVRYVLRQQKASTCPECSAKVALLAPAKAHGAAFYLCRCGFVAQIGVGVLRKGRAP